MSPTHRLPSGTLGTQLYNFWSAIKAQHLKNPPILDYPPHVTLTGFFTINIPGDHTEEDQLISALQVAIEEAQGIIPIQIGGQITQTKSLDYIPISSTVLKSIGVDFLEHAHLGADLIRPKPGAKLGYHITLRQDTQNSTTKEVRKLEKSKIKLAAPNLQKNTNWSLYIYKRTGKKLEVLYSQPITTH